jgi:hypothetical protein
LQASGSFLNIQVGGTGANTKQTTNVPTRRGKEWHAPDYTVLSANHILLVEPVTPGSRVAKGHRGAT